ncbi:MULTISPECIES: AadS family aminoglycoside 6-adenylyltransferase [unclassified Chryseobacterium]|uniref:AadS family aminoglycoside 6-adenylyltransferase n=1 Tax=unclassified Chryseobacterium TaxID=2593645 RepID=UPI001AE9E7D5|nr:MULTISPECIES: AadS family aminoglycoside 6-adenylyltransferase [unclassified Chryseobacterium]MBP1165709.1 aminoglycoside 6-adenylyltransferase [Chryseobacterium sp. PvR013]MDR4893887.1 AadS family aminoglycoside 6-adenylyltransferase [Chryseobacterium sp. CFS7]
MKVREEKLEQIIHWAENNPDIRVVLLTSSLVNPYAPVDDFSDLDIELVFENRTTYESGNEWIKLFGDPISMIEEDDRVFEGKHAMKMVLYKDHVKVDFKLYQVAEFIEEINQETLPEDWDVGYKVLLDKDNLTENLKSPTYQSVMIQKPTEKEFRQLINDFWWDTTYVAKCLKRGDIFYAKFMSENILRTDYLVPLIEWFIAGNHNWNTITTNKHGRLFKKYLSQELWSTIEATFSDSNIEKNWQALSAYADLVHELGTSLAEKFHFIYPEKLENEIRNYLKEVQTKS